MPDNFRARIRMYRQGLGDCFLVTFPRDEKPPVRILIDCGVILGTSDPNEKMREVVADIGEETDHHIDVLVVTHEHWDHVSGFVQAAELFDGIRIDEVWMAWTENSDDKLARELGRQRHAMAGTLRRLSAEMVSDSSRLGRHDTPLSARALEIRNLLSFFGASGNSTGDAMKNAEGLAREWNCYFEPGDLPEMPAGTAVRAYVLGPPRDLKQLKKTGPSRSNPETYHLAALEIGLNEWQAALDNDEDGIPFNPEYRIPMKVAEGVQFFREHYWESYENGVRADWRRIETAWYGAALDLALKMDSATNNTSLVLAFELENGDTLLFPGDAQVGNWLSWESVSFTVDGRQVRAEDLLRRTIVYKAGHHASHNATLREKGLERMDRLQFALVPVDHKMALKKGWDRIPLQGILDALDVRAEMAVLRADEDFDRQDIPRVVSTELYHQIDV